MAPTNKTKGSLPHMFHVPYCLLYHLGVCHAPHLHVPHTEVQTLAPGEHRDFVLLKSGWSGKEVGIMLQYGSTHLVSPILMYCEANRPALLLEVRLTVSATGVFSKVLWGINFFFKAHVMCFHSALVAGLTLPQARTRESRPSLRISAPS